MTNMLKIVKTTLIGWGMNPVLACALMFPIPQNGTNIVGNVQVTEVEPGDNFTTLGRRFDVGYYELVESNPDLNPQAPTVWQEVTIPSKFVLPPGARNGILINLPELRLYYFEPSKNRVLTFPVGVGRQGWGTPVCFTSIVGKTKDPTWHVPESIRVARAEEGVELPKTVAPGPDNPLGDYSMRLAVEGGTYLVHGTNDPSGVGRRSSSGCIRMFPEDIEELFSLTKVGTPVQIVNEPLKTGWDGQHLYLEAHVPLETENKTVPASTKSMVELVSQAAKKYHVGVDWDKAREVAEEQNGIPTIISTNSIKDVGAATEDEPNHPQVIEGSRPVSAAKTVADSTDVSGDPSGDDDESLNEAMTPAED
ncbi:MAG: L,D-transpeptidase family protein [Gammaproteobacteria bacterium]|nr:L,D-transpeptidase family protein [Gammaproteobacteria bacterium]